MTTLPLDSFDPAREYAPPAGSDLYYALLYCAPHVRPALQAVEVFRGLIAQIPRTCSTKEIALTKLTWWHTELHRLTDGQPQHVATRALQPLLARDALLASALFALVDGVAALLPVSRFATADARFEAYAAAHSPLWECHARLAECAGDATSTAGRVGTMLAIVDTLRALRAALTGGQAWLSQDIVARAGTSAETTQAEWYRALAMIELPEFQREINLHLTALRRVRELRCLRSLLRMALATLGVIAEDGYAVWERRVEITPWRKLLCALRTRIEA